MSVIIGIDPGKSGAVVAIDKFGVAVDSIAADDKGSYGGKEYVPQALVDWLVDLKWRETIQLAVVEVQSSRPPEGRKSALTTGYGWGMIVGVLAALGIPYELASPVTWTKSVYGGSGKKTPSERKARSIQWARARVPSLSLVLDGRRVPHHGLSDAAALAMYGWSKYPSGASMDGRLP